jgi:hypothetical protein
MFAHLLPERLRHRQHALAQVVEFWHDDGRQMQRLWPAVLALRRTPIMAPWIEPRAMEWRRSPRRTRPEYSTLFVFRVLSPRPRPRLAAMTAFICMNGSFACAIPPVLFAACQSSSMRPL